MNRKCCPTPRGPGPHKPGCPQNGQAHAAEFRRSLSRMSKRDRIDLLDDIADDMPDGAYFAMADEMGIDVEDFAELSGESGK